MNLWDSIEKVWPYIDMGGSDGPRCPRTPREIGDILGDHDNPVEDLNDVIKEGRNFLRRILSVFDNEEDRKLVEGDIIGICRGLYDHYGVYVNDDSVIHYSSKDSDTSSDNSIIESSLEDFMRGDDTLFKLHFPETYSEPGKIVVASSFAPLMRDYFREWRKWRDYKLYSPKETVQRAKSRLGEKNYSILTNNCEHFAIWCKTGISESHQINKLLEAQKNCIKW